MADAGPIMASRVTRGGVMRGATTPIAPSAGCGKVASLLMGTRVPAFP